MLRPIFSQSLASREELTKSQKISKIYFQCYSEIFVDNEAMNLLLHGHLWNGAWTRECTEAFVKLLNKHSECLSYMASKLPEFQSNDPRDKERSASLFKYYILARYFTEIEIGDAQLDWILGYKAEGLVMANDDPELRTVSIHEVNRWNHLFSRFNIRKLTLFQQFINAVDQEFGFHPCLTPIIGYNLMMSPQQVENLVPIGKPVTSVQIKFLSYLLANIKSIACHEQAEGLNQLWESSSAMARLDLQWALPNIQRLNGIFREKQVDSEYIQAKICIGQFGNFDRYIAIKRNIANLFKLRFDLFLAPHHIQLNPAHFSKLLMFCAIVGSTFDTVLENIQWGMGYAINEFEDAQALAHLPNYNMYEVYLRTGVFIHRKKEALEFKQILQELLDFAKIQYVSYLYLLSMAYDHYNTRQLQQQYQRVLSRMLSFHVRALKVNTGDQALQKLEHLFAKFMSISMRMASDISHDVQHH